MKRNLLLSVLQPLVQRRLVDILDGQQQDRLSETLEIVRGWTVTNAHLVSGPGRARSVGLELHDLRRDGTPAWPGFSLTMDPAPVQSVQHTHGGDCVIRHDNGRQITIRTDEAIT